MVMNRTIRTLEDAIINMLNVTDLPIEVKRLVIADIYHTVLKEADTNFINEIASEETENAESS